MPDYAINVRHTGALSFQVSNGRATLTTQARQPGDQTWMATELFLAGLGSCMLSTLIGYAQTNNIDVHGAGVEVTGESAARPARVERIQVTFELPDTLTDTQVSALVRAGNRCKVHNTIEHNPEITVSTRAIAPITTPPHPTAG